MSKVEPLANACSASVVVPTYDNASALPALLDTLGPMGLDVFVVNDGSADRTADILAAWAKEADGRYVLSHNRNRGKAAALRTGFDAARRAGHTHAITIDSDGQLDPRQIPLFMEAILSDPRALILGVRDEYAPDYPRKSRLGRRLANAMIHLETGQRVRDSQCGFRAYPMVLVEAVVCQSGRYAYETEVITRSLWAGATVVEVPVECRYAMEESGRVSHFRVVRDTLHGAGLHARLLGRALMPLPRRKVWPDADTASTAERPSRLRRVLHWLNPLAAWRGIRSGHYRRGELATGLSLGVFIGNTPTYGFHTAICLYLANRLHLNPHLVIVGSSISTPPLGPLLIALAIAVGHLLLHGSFGETMRYDLNALTHAQTYRRLLLEWIVGSVVVGSVLALLTMVVSYLAFGWLQPKPKTSS